MNRIEKYINYTRSYIKHNDYQSIMDSSRFLLFKKGAKKTRIINSYLGKIKIRKGTNDFQFANYYYEWGVKSYVLENYGKFDVFFDIGSGIGDYAILMANIGLQVFAFEPIKSNYNVMLENIALNHLESKITTHNLAIGKQKSVAKFVATEVNTGASHKEELKLSNPNIKENHTENVEVRGLDELIDEFNLKPHTRVLVKMDMEGMEKEGIQGGINFIQSINNLTIIAEAKHSGEDEIVKELKKVANFDFGEVDEFNIYATKKSNI